MTVRTKLDITLVQHFGVDAAGLLGGQSAAPTPGDRTTAPGGVDAEPERRRLPVAGDVVGGHYRLVRILGEGMFGRVYLAERTDVREHRVALKVVDRAVYAGRNPARELVMLAAATHPNIVQLKDHGMTDEFVWLTMPLYEGETLAERLERGPLSLREAYDLFLPLVRGVEALHARGLRHQDIKPENVFLAEFADRTHPVVLDLGVAVERNASFVAGTLLYGAPEQVVALGGISGSAVLSEKMDVYCLASTLLRTLVPPLQFPGEQASSPFDIANAFEERERAPLRGGALPDLVGEPRNLLNAALGRWMTRDPDDRPSAREMADQLEVLLEQEHEVARSIERNIERQKAAYRRVRIAFGAVAMMAAAAGLYGYSKRETLRLAGELERAKAVGEASFDKLDTCVAAHRLARQEARTCVSERQEEEVGHSEQLRTLAAASQSALDDADEQLATTSTRLRTCQDDAKSDAESWTEERGSFEATISSQAATLEDQRASWEAARKSLQGERDGAKSALTSCEATLTRLGEQQGECRADLAGCIDERDTCMGDLAAVHPAASLPQAAAQPSPAAAPPSEPSKPAAGDPPGKPAPVEPPSSTTSG